MGVTGHFGRRNIRAFDVHAMIKPKPLLMSVRYQRFCHILVHPSGSVSGDRNGQGGDEHRDEAGVECASIVRQTTMSCDNDRAKLNQSLSPNAKDRSMLSHC